MDVVPMKSWWNNHNGLMMQLINTGVSVHMACPGFVNTTMIRQAQKEAVSQPSTIRRYFKPTKMFWQHAPCFPSFKCNILACLKRT